jgi:hypothetical protein
MESVSLILAEHPALIAHTESQDLHNGHRVKHAVPLLDMYFPLELSIYPDMFSLVLEDIVWNSYFFGVLAVVHAINHYLLPSFLFIPSDILWLLSGIYYVMTRITFGVVWLGIFLLFISQSVIVLALLGSSACKVYSFISMILAVSSVAYLPIRPFLEFLHATISYPSFFESLLQHPGHRWFFMAPTIYFTQRYVSFSFDLANMMDQYAEKHKCSRMMALLSTGRVHVVGSLGYFVYPCGLTIQRGPLLMYDEYLMLSSHYKPISIHRLWRMLRKFANTSVLLRFSQICLPYSLLYYYRKDDFYYDWSRVTYFDAYASLIAFTMRFMGDKVIHSTYWVLQSLLCGMDVPENVVGCPYVCSSVKEFWRMWNRGINLWIRRYLIRPFRHSLLGQSLIAWGLNPTYFGIVIGFGYSIFLHHITGRQGWIMAGGFVISWIVLETAFASSFATLHGVRHMAILLMADYMGNDGFSLFLFQQASISSWFVFCLQVAFIMLSLYIHMRVAVRYGSSASKEDDKKGMTSTTSS